MTDPVPTPADPGLPRQRRNLLLILALFLVPTALAIYLAASGWRPEGRLISHGELLQPARALAGVALHDPSGAPVAWDTLRGNWLLVTLEPETCAQVCRENLYKMQQVRLAQGREARRVERVLIVPERRTAQPALTTDYPGLRVLTARPDHFEHLAREFATPSGTALEQPGRVYIVDPIGNLVLSYPPQADPSGMRKDLVRLLRLSQVG